MDIKIFASGITVELVTNIIDNTVIFKTRSGSINDKKIYIPRFNESFFGNTLKDTAQERMKHVDRKWTFR